MHKNPHKELCDFMTAKGKKRKRMILLPRGSFKSSVVTVGYSLWSVVRNPNNRILIASENVTNAGKYLGEIKRHITDNENFRLLFGDLKPIDRGFWRSDAFSVNNMTRVGGKEATMETASIGQTKVGMHYDKIIIDDPVSNNTINTPEQKQKTIDYYKYLLSILDPGAEIILIGTRYDYGDLFGHIYENESEYFDILDRGCTLDRTYDFSPKNLYFPTRLTKEFLEEQRASQGSYVFACTPGETPITLSDFSTKPISEVSVGDEVVGFKMSVGGKKTKLEKSKVLEVNSRLADVYEYSLSNGDFVRCTQDHHWFTGRNDKSHRPYAPLSMGKTMHKVFSDCDLDSNELNYLAGMMDGEGSCKNGTIQIHQSEEHNFDVCRRIERCLSRLGIDPYVYNYPPKNCTQWAFGGRELKVKIIRGCDFGKKEQLIDSIWNHPSKISIDKPKVVKIKKIGKQRVYALTTTSGNYVAWNYASKNCQYMNTPIDSENAVFRADWILTYETAPHALQYFMAIDPAASVKKEADYTAIIVAGVDHDSNIFVCENLQLKETQADWMDIVFELVEKYGIEKDGAVALETNAFQQTIKYAFDLEMEKRKFYFPIAELKPAAGASKERRIRALQPFFEKGKVFIKKDHGSLKEQLIRFPKNKNDDQVDALSSILQIMYPARLAEVTKSDIIDKNKKLSFNEKQIWKDLDNTYRRMVKRRKRGMRI